MSFPRLQPDENFSDIAATPRGALELILSCVESLYNSCYIPKDGDYHYEDVAKRYIEITVDSLWDNYLSEDKRTSVPAISQIQDLQHQLLKAQKNIEQLLIDIELTSMDKGQS